MENIHEGKEKTQNAREPALPNKYLMLAGGIIVLVLLWVAIKAIFSPIEKFKLTLVNAPSEVAAGAITTFTWRIDGPPTKIHHTSVYLGTTSNPGDLGKDIKAADTKYTEYVKDFADGDYDVPLLYVGNITLSNPGKYYYRVHAVIKDKDYWSDEYSLEVQPSSYRLSLISVPEEVTAGKIMTFTWRIDGPPIIINHTAVYFGLESNPGDLGEKVKPSDTEYTDYTKEFSDSKSNVPLQYIGNVKIASPGAYFFRVYADIDGKNFWTKEGQFEAK